MALGKKLIAMAAAAALVLVNGAAPAARAQDSEIVAWRALHEELAIAGVLERLRAAPAPEIVILRNVGVVDPMERTVREGQSIVASLGRIYQVLPVPEEPQIEGALIIDGGGRYAAPGLTDMHIHSTSASSYLLNIANGVTTVREMDGFPWMLAARDAVNNDRMLGPTSYVASTILNYVPMGGYAVVVQDAPTARRVVRQQAACGYDFIKIHNLMPQRVFDTIAEEARRAGLDPVGHVPHFMSVRHAAEQGMRTMEHLKGWLNDRTLTPGDTDFAAGAVPDVWVTPTGYAYRNYAEAEAMEAMRTGPASRYVPARTRAQWSAFVETASTPGFALNLNARLHRREIMRQLVSQGARFLAGTDAANYPFQTMGFALVEELRLLREAGVPEEQVFRAATTEPAAAMRAERDFGRIAPGMRADIVLTTRNPLEGAHAAYSENQGVMLRGRWLERAAIDRALAELADLYTDDQPAPRLTRASADAAARAAEALVASGFVFNPGTLREAATVLRRAGHNAAAGRLVALAIAPTSGPCAAITP
ncbi:MAG TPA: amidohydrolase family protein [Vitreimonas sp.]|uniref:amidohydrolase family protein n=1 Tax=Vitreimonas sp. TaxID=3069702 RepID=UPI002D622FB5|nr:amidohydrolase family protein [Vitreimonas sp.]HYD89458.1 amidohydrolase family protein [Vitreimonas sp.]